MRSPLFLPPGLVRCGSVTFVQRFGDALKLNLPFYTFVLDGVYVRNAAHEIRFRPLPPPDDDEIARIVLTISRRLVRLLERRGLGRDDSLVEVDPFCQDQQLLASLYGASVRQRVATGPRRGQRVERLGDRIDAEDVTVSPGSRCASVAVGNGIRGVPLDERGLYVGSFQDLLGPYQLLVGLFAVALFAMHGAIFLFLKTEGAVQERLGKWMWHTWGLFLVLYLLTTMYTLLAVPTATENFRRHPWVAGVVLVSVMTIANIPRTLFTGKFGQAFLSSSLTIATLVFLFAVAVYPNIVTASNDPANSLTMYTAASSEKTLGIGLLIVAIGLPFVLAYTAAIYWTFRGKVEIGEHSF